MDVKSVTPELLLHAYASGIFPMSEGRDDPDVFWVEPDERGILPLARLHIPRSLAKVIRKAPFELRLDTAFREVMQACAETGAYRKDTWISEGIEDLYCTLFDMGFAHSVECWQNDTLVGGLYGVSLRGAFFGESMFHRQTDASKVALVHLVASMLNSGYKLLDVQFQTDHLRQFGVREVTIPEYKDLLADALQSEASLVPGFIGDGKEALALINAAQAQPVTQTS